MRKLLYAGAATLGLGHLLRRRRSGGIVLCYHNVIADDDEPPGDAALHLPVREFDAQLDVLDRYFSVITLGEMVDRQRSGRTLRGTVAITFDDGYRGVLLHALPRLRARAVPATMFVTSAGADSGATYWWDWPKPGAEAGAPVLRTLLLDECRGDRKQIAEALGVEAVEAAETFRPASWEELRAASGPDFTFGVHTVSHRNLAALDRQAVRQELTENASDIERELGVQPFAVAYPYGAWSPAVASEVAAVGLRAGLTLDSHDVVSSTHPMSLPRVNVPASLSVPAFTLWVSGLAAIRAR